MTNYGLLTILDLPRLPNARMAPSEADLRLMADLETFPPRGGDWHGDRVAGIRLLAEQSGMSPRTVQRARDRLVKAGLIECEPGAGTAQSTWRFLFPMKRPGGDSQDVHTSGPSGDIQDVHTRTGGGDSQGVHTSPGGAEGGDINMSTQEPGGGDNEAALCGHHGGATLFPSEALTGVEVGEPADRAGARGADPLEGRVLPPGSAPRLPRNACEFCGSFGHITARCEDRDLAQEERDDRIKTAVRNGEAILSPNAERRLHDPGDTAERGAALARKLMADRPEKPPEEVTRPRTDDERQAFALRQAAEGRVARGEPVLTSGEGGADEAPLWQEEDPDEPPF